MVALAEHNAANRKLIPRMDAVIARIMIFYDRKAPDPGDGRKRLWEWDQHLVRSAHIHATLSPLGKLQEFL